MKEAVMLYAVLLTSQDSVNKQTAEQRTYATQTGVPDTFVPLPLDSMFRAHIKQNIPQITDSVREIMTLQYCYESCISFLNLL